MAHQETALRTTLEIGAWSVAFAGAAVLLLALVAELLRRRRPATPLVALADRLLPSPSRRVAVALLTLVSTVGAFSVPPSARADDQRTRAWLEERDRGASTTPTRPTSTSTSSTSTSTPPTPSPTTTTARATAPTAPVIAPRATAVLREDPPPSPARAAERPSAVAPAPAVPAPVPAPAVTVPPGAPTYTVAPGDCLWSIAARRLGATATRHAVDRAWRAIYTANRGAIGADPNLIHPGLVLMLPPLDPTA
jgi:nucleoid-associated protein YgaU